MAQSAASRVDIDQQRARYCVIVPLIEYTSITYETVPLIEAAS